jgi:tRNA 2-thiocytidine biosynthesis protein TtcA
MRLQKRLRHYAGRAIEDYKMLEEGDRLMVRLSGETIPMACSIS